MYDLHNHLLPGIDDGAPDLETAIELAKIAIEDGITHMVCTPHIHPGRFNNTIITIQTALKTFQEGLKKNKLELKVAAAAEVRIGPEILQAASSKNLPFLGKWNNRSVLLLELPSNTVPLGSEKLTQWLINQNITPIIAHPERNQVFQKHPERLDRFIEHGCLIQVTASALLGNFGNQAKILAFQLLQQEKITIIGSDAHNKEYRPPELSLCYEFIATQISEETAIKLLIDNPSKISSSMFI